MPAAAGALLRAQPGNRSGGVTNERWDGFHKYLKITDNIDPIKCVGRVNKVQGLLIESRGPHAVIGEICRIEIPKKYSGKTSSGGIIRAEVVGLRNETVQLMAYEETDGIEIGCRVIASGSRLDVGVSPKLLGRVLDPLGKPMDDKGAIEYVDRYPALANAPDPVKRRRITERLCTGVRAIDGLLAVGRGQRLGIFSGSGVGKSTLLGMIARNTSADVNVVALIGERGRELNDFIEKDLGPEGLARTVIVVTPSNSPPLCRLRGAYVATAVAEYFRDQGLDVMLLFDSVTRFARAQREIGLASGEPSATRGYPPSMFDSMPKLLERCGTSDKGTITGFYTILVDGDDMDEPVADTVRGILDGHIVLSRNLARQYHYPAIDVLDSISRLAGTVAGPETSKAAGVMRRNLAVYAEAEDLINVGAYKPGSNAKIDEAISKRDALEDFLIQNVDDKASLNDVLAAMSAISGIQIPENEMEPDEPDDSEVVNAKIDELDDYFAEDAAETTGSAASSLLENFIAKNLPLADTKTDPPQTDMPSPDNISADNLSAENLSTDNISADKPASGMTDNAMKEIDELTNDTSFDKYDDQLSETAPAPAIDKTVSKEKAAQKPSAAQTATEAASPKTAVDITLMDMDSLLEIAAAKQDEDKDSSRAASHTSEGIDFLNELAAKQTGPEENVSSESKDEQPTPGLDDIPLIDL